MRAGVPKETLAGETRVAIVPDVLPKLRRAGWEILIERGAGEASGFTDAQYQDKGAELVDRDAALACECVLAIAPPAPDALREGTILLCMPDPLGAPQGIAALAMRGVTCFALELMPRISRAQAMDVLSSMATVAGYKAVLLGAARLPKLFPLLMTAAGTVRPAKVFVLGAGVAGLQAIATARRLGALVEAYDIRAATAEQVESLGARFVQFDLGTGDAQDEGGYAKELTDEQKARQAELMAAQIQACDLIITTAAVPGRRSPILVPGSVVEGMKPGSVIVDMAAEGGGNCELTEPGKEVVAHGVTIVGLTNLPASVPASSSQLYANNVLNFLTLLVDEGELKIDLEDECIQGSLACHKGEVTNERIREALS
jgi:NAD(P) transhydrogenase subunit alpha